MVMRMTRHRLSFDWIFRDHTLLLVALATLGGAVLRFGWLDAQPLWGDERGQISAASMSLRQMFATVRGHAAAAPLDYLGTRAMIELFGPGQVVRLWPALVGTATIPVLFAAGQRFVDRRAAAIAAVLLAAAPFHIYYSGEARFYALSALSAVLCVLTFRTRAFAPAVAMTLYTHYFAFIVPLGLVVLHRTGWRALGLGVVAWLPWAVYALPSQIGHRQDIGVLSCIPTPTLLAELIVPDFNVSGLPAIVPALALGIVGTLVVLGARQTWWLLAIVVGAIVLTGLATWRNEYFWSPRQIIFVLPLLLLTVGVGWRQLPRPTGILAVVGLLAIWAIFIVGVIGSNAWLPRGTPGPDTSDRWCPRIGTTMDTS